MSNFINIAGMQAVEDPSYRYKMPRIMGKVEGRGNGIKTVLANVVDVASSLNREPQEITKFFGTDLGAQTTYDEAIDRAIVNGAHTDTDLQNKLRTYIEKFVLCLTCRYPETGYKVKDGIIVQKCLACGAKTRCDMTHKLTVFILAQHKKHKKEEQAKDKERAKSDKKKSKDDTPVTPSSADGDGDAQEEKKEKKAKKEKKDKDGVGPDDKKKSKKDKGNGESSPRAKTFFDEEEGSDSGPGEDKDEEVSDAKAVEDAILRMKSWFERTGVPTGGEGSDNLSRIAGELRTCVNFANLRPSSCVQIYIGSVMSAALLSGKEIEKCKEVLTSLSKSTDTQRHVIAAFEWFCGSLHPTLAPKFPLVLKALFDEEIVDESVFFDWSADYAKNDYSVDASQINVDILEELKLVAGPFITWLREADEEGESDEEEEEA